MRAVAEALNQYCPRLEHIDAEVDEPFYEEFCPCPEFTCCLLAVDKFPFGSDVDFLETRLADLKNFYIRNNQMRLETLMLMDVDHLTGIGNKDTICTLYDRTDASGAIELLPNIKILFTQDLIPEPHYTLISLEIGDLNIENNRLWTNLITHLPRLQELSITRHSEVDEYTTLLSILQQSTNLVSLSLQCPISRLLNKPEFWQIVAKMAKLRKLVVHEACANIELDFIGLLFALAKCKKLRSLKLWFMMEKNKRIANSDLDNLRRVIAKKENRRPLPVIQTITPPDPIFHKNSVNIELCIGLDYILSDFDYSVSSSN
jgi:hypothetical protein